MTTITLTITGEEAVIAHLKKVGNGVINLAAPMSDIGTYLTRFFSGEVFASRGGIIGEPWRPLNSQYAVEKARTWPGRPPLVRTGLMQRSFKKNAGRMSVTIFNSARHFDYHQEGTRRIPRRVMMKIDKAREARLTDILQGYINGLTS